ncbi:MAG: DUF4293 domain-containing protein [Bacteroidota bacterium]
MIQRIQSLFLLIAILLNLAGLFLPLWQFVAGAESEVVSGLSVVSEFSGQNEMNEMFYEHKESSRMIAHSLFVGLNALVTIGLILIIFQFNNRPRQIKLAYIGMVLVLFEILAIVWFTNQGPTGISGTADQGLPHIGFALPIAAVAFIWLAIKRIQADENLVKSIDSGRIR